MRIDALDVSFYEIPLETPESDGTLTWDRTGVVVVEPHCADRRGLGFIYGPRACATLILDVLSREVVGREASDVSGAWQAMVRSIRNAGRPGIASMAIAAVDIGLWDLRARLEGVSLADLLGNGRANVPIYWSGGFTSYSDEELAAELSHAVYAQGFPRIKMKIACDRGRRPEADIDRVSLARKVIGDETELYVDANGGYTRDQAVRMASILRDGDVSWFEEPVSSDDLEGLQAVRDATDIDVAAGEYGYDFAYFERMVPFVDVLQIDASRCAGFTEWLRVAEMARAHGLEVSAHTAQSLHVHVAGAAANLRHIEYFADHHRVDRLLFEGVPEPRGGFLRTNDGSDGMGMELKRSDADRYLIERGTKALQRQGA
ncbi:MAG: mandelate racemase [Actinomycetota bacterium]|nr:mandelate racemase [Actinomycetota bacterium]